MITIVLRETRSNTPSDAKVLGTITVVDDQITQTHDDLFGTVRNRAARAPGRTLEQRLRAAYPYSNGYVTWDVTADTARPDENDPSEP